MVACSDDRTKVILITDPSGLADALTDKIYQELNTISDYYNLNIELYTPTDSISSSSIFSAVVAKEPDIIITAISIYETDLIISAVNNKQIQYLMVGSEADLNMDGNTDSENITSVIFSNSNEGFIAGLAAGLLTDNNLVCYVGSEMYKSDIEFYYGFIYGLACINKDIKSDYIYIGNYFSAAESQAKISELETSNYDVLYFTSNNEIFINLCINNDFYTIRNTCGDFRGTFQIIPEINLSLKTYFEALKSNSAGEILEFDIMNDAYSIYSEIMVDQDIETVQRYINYVKYNNIDIPKTKVELDNKQTIEL